MELKRAEKQKKEIEKKRKRKKVVEREGGHEIKGWVRSKTRKEKRKARIRKERLRLRTNGRK